MKIIEEKKDILHISIIVVGIIFILISAFHSNIWFDESYSVAIAKHNIIDIWNITGNDVHPALYYWMLHFIYLIFGNSVVAYRIFSALAIIILGILGITHIRKDFGKDVGILFSFLTYFLPVMCTYSQEVRMYSWSCLIVTFMSIYAYRFYRSIKNSDNKKITNLIIFGIFSIASCYIHYYALVTAGLVNLFLLVYLIKNAKNDKESLKNFLILAVIQIILYIPWLMYFLGQIRHVEGGFWISLDAIRTTTESLSFQFRRQLDTNFSLNFYTIMSLLVAVAMYIYIGVKIYKNIKEKKDITPAILSCCIYIGVILIVLAISIFTPILFARYLMVLTGLYIFTFAFIISMENRKWVTVLITTIILILGIVSNVTNVIINYDESNMKQIEYIKENMTKEDILIYSNIGNGGVVAAFFPENKQYFYNGAHWDIEEAYKAYGPGMETIYDYNEVLDNYHGRIWLIDSENMGLWDEFPKDNITVLKEATRFDTKYQNYVYNIMLLEKK